MNDWERAICSRVKTIREHIRWGQPDFAQQIGITRDQLAGIEGGRTPLRYGTAWRIHEEFGISLTWLDEGDGFPDSVSSDDKFVPPGKSGPLPRVLLSSAARFAQAVHAHSQGALTVSEDEVLRRWRQLSDSDLRWINQIYLEIFCGNWIASVPEGHVDQLTGLLAKTAGDFIGSFPPDAEDEVERRAYDIIWRRLRTANARKFLIHPKKALQTFTPWSKTSNVKSELAMLMDRLKRATKAIGRKGELARYLRVPQSRVSEWLSGRKEPGGQTTLKLLRWVERQERK
ncbi:MAG: helix-turn-helix domain-containing protein [Limisphaerales bacterium]